MNLEVHCHFNKNLSLIPIISYMDPVHTLTFYLFEINFNIFLPFMLRYLSSSLFPSGFLAIILYAAIFCATYFTHFIIGRIITYFCTVGIEYKDSSVILVLACGLDT